MPFVTAIKKSFSDDILSLSAALAFYLLVAIAPMTILIFHFVGNIVGQDVIANVIIQETTAIAGQNIGTVMGLIINATQSQNTVFQSIVSTIIALLSATILMVHLQHVFNGIWKTRHQWNVLKVIHRKLIALIAILIILIMLSVSIIISVFINQLFSSFFSDGIALTFANIVNYLLTFAFLFVLFAILFKLLPDKVIKFSEVKRGAFITAILFIVGQLVLSLYFAFVPIGSVYGAAGSILVFLLWVYYSSVIFLFGAELTATIS